MGNIFQFPTSRLSLLSSSTSASSNAMNPRIVEKLKRIKYYFASRTSAYDDIWNICYRLSDEIHEQVLDVFILIFIDHWDKELERYVLLCEHSLILMDFDFECLEIRQLFIYDYARFNSIRIGPLIYPQTTLNFHRSRYAMRFQWDSHKPLNYKDYWNPWSKEIPWITLAQHPLVYYIDDVLNEQYCHINDNNDDSMRSSLIEDQYFTEEYLQQIRRRFSIEIFHDKLIEILNSFQQQPIVDYPRLSIGYTQNQIISESSNYDDMNEDQKHSMNMVLENAIKHNVMFEIHHHSSLITIIHYANIMCDNYFNIPSMLYNRINLGYYRLRLF